MPTSQLMKKCVRCKKKTLHIQEVPNYLLHIVLSILTVGVWIIVWVLFINKKDPQCTVCGETNDFLGNMLHRQKSNIEKVSNENDDEKPKDFLGKLLDGQRKNIEKVSKDKD